MIHEMPPTTWPNGSTIRSINNLICFMVVYFGESWSFALDSRLVTIKLICYFPEKKTKQNIPDCSSESQDSSPPPHEISVESRHEKPYLRGFETGKT